MSRYADIYAALKAHLRTFPGWDDALCSWPGRPFTPPNTGHWRVSLLPAGADAALGETGSIHERGIWQVSRYEPKDSGLTPALTAADAMAAHFLRRRLAAGAITLQTFVPELDPVIPEPTWIHVPVSIRYLVL